MSQRYIIRNILLSTYDTILENRSNPELNTYESVSESLKMYKNMNDVYIQFSDVMKIGINPYTYVQYDTPAGIYTYPINYILKLYESSKKQNNSLWRTFKHEAIPFAGDRKYIHVFQVPNSLVVDASDYTKTQFKKDAQALFSIAQQERWFNSEYTFKNFLKDSLDFSNESSPMSDLFAACILVLKQSGRAHKPFLWNGLLRKLGYYGISDKKGTGTIHESEPFQAFFLSVEHIVHLQTIDNIDTQERKGKKFEELPDEEKRFIVFQHPEIMKIKDVPVKLQIDVVKSNPKIIQYIKNPSEIVQITAVSKNGDVIQYIENPNEKVQLEAVKNNYRAIQFIENPSETVQLEAVYWTGLAIQYIKNPSEKVQLEAVGQNAFAIQFIKNPSLEVQIVAVRENGEAIKYIENPSIEVQLEAVKFNGFDIRFIKNPSEKVQLAAVKVNKRAINFIKNPSNAVKQQAKER